MKNYSRNPLKNLNSPIKEKALTRQEKYHEKAVILFCLLTCVGLFAKVVFF